MREHALSRLLKAWSGTGLRESGWDGTTLPADDRETVIVRICLLFLLIYSTATVFVRSSWPLQSFQAGIFLLVAVYLLAGIRGRTERLAGGWTPWLVYLIPVWGLVQLLAHVTASTLETREAVLRWGALAGVFFLSQTVARTKRGEHIVLGAFLCFATAMALLCLTQLFTSRGHVFWIFPTGYPDVYATFPSHNNYAQFVELALPIAFWRALRDGRKSRWYGLAGGVLYASVISSASRTGMALCTAEVLAVLAIGLAKLRDPKTGRQIRSVVAMLVMVPILAAVFTVAAGWQRVWHQSDLKDSYLVRREYIGAAVEMAKHRPLTGYGLGTFTEVYQQYATRDFPFYANHAHNDWAEFAAGGGIPFLLLVLIPFAAAVPTALRHPWGLGLVAVMLHACVDFPFPRPAVSGWMFLMLGLIYMTRTRDMERRRLAKLSTAVDTSAHSAV